MPGQQSQASAAPVVVVTGASAGVGRAIAVAFARRGWSVALFARGVERLESAARDVELAGGRALVLPGDVADSRAVQAAAEQAVAEFGRIDVWVNNAMATVYSPVAAITPEEVKRVTEVTYLGQVHGTMAALRHMRLRDRGTIVQVGSALAYRAIPLQSAYCAAKFAVRGFTDALRSELIHEGSRIRITMVQLPAVDTPQFDWARSRLPRRLQPVPPIFAPDAVANAIFHAAREAPRELWVGRPAVQAIIGGLTMPDLADHLAARQAWSGQMTQEPATSRPDNLFDPPAGDPGSHGRFGEEALAEVASFPESAVRMLLSAGALTAISAAVGLGYWLGARPGRAGARRSGARVPSFSGRVSPGRRRGPPSDLQSH